MPKLLTGNQSGLLQTWVGEYDFAVDAGAIGAITIRSNAGAIPSGAQVLGGVLEILTGFTTGSAATMALSVNGANDLVSATVVSGAPYSTTGNKSIIPVFTGATAIKTTAERNPTATIAVGTVTAGKFRLTLVFI